MKTLIVTLTVSVLFATSAGAVTTFTLDPPSGAISGPAGTTVGWGFTFFNDTNYAVITGTQFCASTSSPLPAVCAAVSPDLGTYTDFAGPQFLVVGPAPDESPTLSQSFDNTTQSGLGSFTFDPGASGTASGILVLTYDLFSVSPNNPNFSFNDEISGGNFLAANASVTVQPANVPEPATLLLLCAGAAGAVLRRRVGLAGCLRARG